MAKRRGAGEGSIFRRKDGFWVSSLTVGYDEKGRRRRRDIYGKRRADVALKLRELQAQGPSTTLADSATLTVAGALERWLREHVQKHLRPTTHELYASLVHKHVNPYIGGVRLSKLTPAHIEALIETLEGQNSSQRLVESVYQRFRTALEWAKTKKLIPANPAAEVTKPSASRPEHRPLTLEEAELLLDAARAAESRTLGTLVIVALGSGARIGELLGLRWGDVDERAGTLHVRRTLVQVKGKLEVGPPKTEASKREIPLLDFAQEALADLRRGLSAIPHTSAWVFGNGKGANIHAQNFRRRFWRPLLKSAGLPPIRFHDLRGTYGTLLAHAGVNPRVAQRLLGHSRIETTLGIYTKASDELMRDGAERVGALFGKG